MPIHDWTRVSAGNFHHFHQRWIGSLSDSLNGGALPDEYEARIEPVTGKYSPDVVTLHTHRPGGTSGASVTLAPPTAQQVIRIDRQNYARRKDRVVIRHDDGQVVAIIELVSPGNKDGQRAVRTFVEKAADILDQGVNLLVVDLFPPGPRDPHGVHGLIADEFDESSGFRLPPGRPLTVVSYMAGFAPQAFVDNLAVGDRLPDAPLFLTDEAYVPCPLEATYMHAFGVLPRSILAALTPST